MTLMISTHRLAEPTMAIAIEPQGEIRSEDAHKLSDRVIAVLAATRPQRIVVDLSSVTSLSDAGIVALRSGHEDAAAQDANLVVVDPDPQVREQLRRGGLDDLLDGSGSGSRS
ncbi:STAS domain-containing protein [Actinoplanes sp. NPDC048967]|uniref:STAS domain-containing protein n=1 Tax=Actinoplanes sp. NPDC048967 TaxID=3155269 RepID=UPI0033F07909